MTKIAAVLLAIFAIWLAYVFNYHLLFPIDLPDIEADLFSLNQGKLADKSLNRFEISVSENFLETLRTDLSRTLLFQSLPDSKFLYGANSEYLGSLRDHWINVYNWRKWEAILNKFQHFKTHMQGLDVHFVRCKPPADKYRSIRPLLLVHGWPGSVFEFYKILPILSDPASFNIETGGVAFDVVAPSIPGYGWSDKPQKSGFAPVAASKLFGDLMIKRLLLSKFYCQGGDWGSILCTYMAEMFPQNVLGIHLNMAQAPLVYAGLWVQMLLGYIAPRLVFDSSADYKKIYPIGPHLMDLLQESGYFHIQATKPDTIGFALLNSPMALAAFIVEKFSSWTNLANRNLTDGGLNRHFSMDELLTSVMVYYTTGTILSSQRFYKEHFLHPLTNLYDRALVNVPTGIASFPNEPLRCQPKNFLAYKYRNITLYDDMPKGGHFAAFEEPHLLAQHIFKFLQTL